MENPRIIYPELMDEMIPELWYMYARNGTLFFTFNETCWSAIQELEIPESAEMYRPARSPWGFEQCFKPVCKRSDGTYGFDIPLRDQMDKKKRNQVAKSLAQLTYILDIHLLYRGTDKKIWKYHQGDQAQLFSLETIYVEKPTYHGAAMDVSISPVAAQFLVANSMKEIPGVRREMKCHHIALHPKDKKKGFLFHTDLTGVIREKGTLNFVTFGNCACLGHQPENIEEGQGLYIDSHNLDTPWQQLSMLVGIATMWEWVRQSLGYK